MTVIQQANYPASGTGTAASSHQITFPSAPVSGNRLVVVVAAPATITTPAGWAKDEFIVGVAELAVFSRVSDGSETSVSFTLSGARRMRAWFAEMDDYDAVHAGAGDDTLQAAATSIAVGPVPTTADGVKIVTAVCTISTSAITQQVDAWTPPLSETTDAAINGGGTGDENVWLEVAHGAAGAAGNHTYTASGLSATGGQQHAVLIGYTASLPAAENVIEAENRLAGTAQATWDVAGAGDATVQGFATAMSVDQGGTLSLKVHSPAAFDVQIYRLGYYAGQGARLITTVAGTPTTQPSGTVDGTTLMADCSNWSVTASWSVPVDACPGVYIARPTRTDTSGASHIPFIVRDSSRKAPTLIVTSDSTWQAYNHAGADPSVPLTGTSLYGSGTASAFTFSLPARCKAVSYNRPWVTRQHIPQTWLFNAEYPLLRWMERNGYDVDYASCADIDADPTLLLGRDVVIVHGHSEYWSATMLDALEAARDAGVHVLALSGNSLYWRITYDAQRRTYACWKDSHDGALNSTGVYGGTWRDTRAFNPDRRPENEIFGQFFRVNGIRADDLVVPDTYKDHPVWRDTTVATLTSGAERTYPDLLGFEWDEDRAQERPGSWIQLSSTTVAVTGMLASEDGDTYTGTGSVTHHLGAYRAASGAVVFGAGMNQLAWALDATHDRTVSSEQDDIQQMLTNLLADLGVTGPDASRQATLVEPSPVSLSTYGFPDVTDPSAPTGLTATAGDTGVTLNWTAATDDVAVTGYGIYRDGAQLGGDIGAVLTYLDTTAIAGSTYLYEVDAVDAAGNRSTKASVTITVSATLDLTTDVGKARLLAADVDPANLLLTDAQYEALLDMEGDNVKLAAAQALGIIASSEALVSKVIRTQDLSTDGAKLSAELRARATELRRQVEEDDPDTAGGFGIVDFIPPFSRRAGELAEIEEV